MQGIGASRAEHRMLYTALLYTPGKEHTRYLVDFELDALAEQVRSQARALGVAEVGDLIAITDGGNGLEEELRKLIGYFENNRHRTDYPTYRRKGWDIGSGPTEAGRKIIGERLKGSGMRWVEDGAVTVASLRALYVSGDKIWDGVWAQPRRRRAA